MPLLFDSPGNLDAYTSAGVVLSAARTGSKGLTLVSATTYYIPIITVPKGNYYHPASEAQSISIHAKWAAAVAATLTLETCDFPEFDGDSTADVTDYSATVGDWQKFNEPAAYVPVTGTGNSAAAATVTAGGTNAGSAVFEISDFASRRLRLKVVVTTGGLMRVGAWVKER